jgi:hypothetical protein
VFIVAVVAPSAVPGRQAQSASARVMRGALDIILDPEKYLRALRFLIRGTGT